MERIQSAIEKAREARQKRLGDPAPAVNGAEAVVAPAGATDPAAIDATAAADVPADVSEGRLDQAWEALPHFQPDLRLLSRNRVVAYQPGPASIPFDLIRTKLLHQMRSNGWQRVAITSPTSGCGKTMLALNLAFSLGRQFEMRTFLCDLDLRRPSMAKVLGLREKHQFARVLEGKEQIESHAVRYGTNLAIATNQSAARHPAEVLHGASVGVALAAIETRYAPDIMIFDMPPMLVSDDTMAFLDHTDCVLLVGAAESSTIEEIDRCERELASRTNVLGVVLNKCRYLDKSESYDYGY